MKKETTSVRLKKIMVDRNMRQIDILNASMPYCKKFNVKMNKSDISQYVSGKVEPSQDKLAVLGMALNVNEAWLMGLDVPMTRLNYEFRDILPIQNSTPEEVARWKEAYNRSNLRKDKLLLAIDENLNRLNNDGKKAILEYSNVLMGNPNYVANESNDNLALNAAHDYDATPEEEANVDSIMKDDSEWE